MTKKDIEIQATIQLRLEIERGLYKSLITERIDSISELGDKKLILKYIDGEEYEIKVRQLKSRHQFGYQCVKEPK